MLPTIARAELDIRPIQWLGLPRDYLQDGEMEVIVALVNSVEARVMFEFGCRNGRTARVLLHNVLTLEDYVGVDVPMTYEPALEHQRAEMVEWPGEYATKDPRFALIIQEHGTLDLGPKDLGPCDACFIDGDHSERVVAHDSDLAYALVRPGGVIIWHDYGNACVDVSHVLNHRHAQGWPVVHVRGTWLAFCRR